jgi:pimeloyl-ACP methyl ester carboxylesterase
MKQIFYTLAATFFLIGCNNAPQPPIQLNDLSDEISVKTLGKRLIDLPFGLNALELSEDEAQEVFIAVHGGSSEGYEWIYPIKIIDTKQKHMYFYRWPDNGCFQSSAEELASEINNLLSQNSSYKKVTLMGHSYGGLLVAHVLKHWNAHTPVEVHIVASPLLGMSMLQRYVAMNPLQYFQKIHHFLNGGLNINLIAHSKIY